MQGGKWIISARHFSTKLSAVLCKPPQIKVWLFNSGLKQRRSKTTIQLQILVIQDLPTHSQVLTGQGRRKTIQDNIFLVFCCMCLSPVRKTFLFHSSTTVSFSACPCILPRWALSYFSSCSVGVRSAKCTTSFPCKHIFATDKAIPHGCCNDHSNQILQTYIFCVCVDMYVYTDNISNFSWPALLKQVISQLWQTQESRKEEIW